MSITASTTSNNKVEKFDLVAQLIISSKIRLLTGLHIGGTESDLSIGGVDAVVVRNGFDGKPYIPGSSLKGKMRSVLEKVYCPGELKSVANSRIFVCASLEDYNSPAPNKGILYHIFGTTPEDVEKLKNKAEKDKKYPIQFAMPTRLIIRDASLDEESTKKLEDSLYLDLPYTQIKTEVVIDRITSQATPRKVERVPAGVAFDFQMVLNLYDPPDLSPEWLQQYIDILIEGFELIENDYIGGLGSRGYGQIRFEEVSIKVCDHKNKNLKERDEIKRLESWANSR